MEELLLRYASPTLASLKTGNLLSYRSNNTSELGKVVERYNTSLKKKGVRVTLLSKKDDLHLIYIYRPAFLERSVQETDTRMLLRLLGYEEYGLEYLITRLRLRLKDHHSFPHEIGVFLGYPIEDVKEFISQKGCNGKCDGCWKVYTDVEKAQETFLRYKKCTRIYLNLHANGKSIEELTVQRRTG